MMLLLKTLTPIFLLISVIIAIVLYIQKNTNNKSVLFILDVWQEDKDNQRWFRDDPDEIKEILKRNLWMKDVDFYISTTIIGKKGQIIHHFHDSSCGEKDILRYNKKLKEIRNLKTKRTSLDLYECNKCEIIYNKKCICSYCKSEIKRIPFSFKE